MATHAERLDTARSCIRYICGGDAEAMRAPVPNCPGWTGYNAAVHIGRVAVAWKLMIQASPDDPDSRTRGYADAESRGSGHAPSELATWALDAIDALEGDVDRPAYFSMTGGFGTVGLWGWHAASELGVHRLDIESARGESYSISHDQAVDALEYTSSYFLPAMARVLELDPAALTILADAPGAAATSMTVRAEDAHDAPACAVKGAAVDLLLALWGRPHGAIDVTGEDNVFTTWKGLPSRAFQFGTWD